jgi:hypothetical protein
MPSVANKPLMLSVVLLNVVVLSVVVLSVRPNYSFEKCPVPLVCFKNFRFNICLNTDLNKPFSK